MGNCCAVEGAVNHWVYVNVGDRKRRVNNVKLSGVITDINGNESPELYLDFVFKNEEDISERNVFPTDPLGEKFHHRLSTLEVWRVKDNDDDVVADLYVTSVEIVDRRTNQVFHFPINKWMEPGEVYMISPNDTCLPQADNRGGERDKQLEDAQSKYEYCQRAVDMPVQIYELPSSEVCSHIEKYDIVERQQNLLSVIAFPRLNQAWTGLADLSAIFYHPFDEPTGIESWSNDVCFGAQRLIGCNPMAIKRCTELPENIGVTAEELHPFLEGWSVQQIINARRLFIVDLAILDNIQTDNGNVICSPIVLLFVNGQSQLLPIAIQLKQHIAPDNPVFLPSDHPFTWMVAKMWFNSADSTIHRCLNHIAFTHLIMEGMYISMKRHLSDKHPIHRLLAPHFNDLIAINANGLESLIAPGHWIDNCTSIGRRGMLELIARGMDEWRLDVHGTLPHDIQNRGLSDVRVLPHYYYRDDGLKLYECVRRYVTEVVNFYYSDMKKILGDWELQGWVEEMVKSKELGGVGINGVPGNGQIREAKEIIDICTSIMFTVSGQFAAITLDQYDEYAFVPSYPTLLHGRPPMNKMLCTEEDLIRVLPSKRATLQTMALTKLLGQCEERRRLGDMAFKFQYDKEIVLCEDRFREELSQLSTEMKIENDKRPPLYKYSKLDPQRVPNSITI